MLQIFVYDSTGAKFELDTYEEQPLKLTLSAEEITGIPQINSAFSKEFRIPATQNNSKVGSSGTRTWRRLGLLTLAP